MCGTVEKQVPEWKAMVAVCQNSRKRWLLDTSVQLFWRLLRDNSLERPENCCNFDEILISWDFKRAGVFWWSVYGKFRLIKLPALSTL